MPASTAYALGDLFTISRGSKRTVWDATGQLVELANAVPGLTYDPATLAAQGLLIEPTTTNLLRNPRNEGASLGIIGSGGVLPTQVTTSGSLSPVTREVVGSGMENGIPYVDYRFSSAGLSASSYLDLNFEAPTSIAAVVGDQVAYSGFFRLISGALPSAGLTLRCDERDANGAFTRASDLAITPNGAPLRLQRSTLVTVIASAGTAFVQPKIRFGGMSGEAFAFTLRVGALQVEKAPGATSPVLPPAGTLAAAVRIGDLAQLDLTKVGFANTGSSFVITATPTGFPATGGGILRLDDGSNDNYLALYLHNSGILRIESRVDAGEVVDRPIGAVTLGQDITIRWTFGRNYLRSSLNGGASAAHAMTGYPTNLNRCYLGARWVGGGSPFQGTIRRFDIIPRTATEAELPTLSA